MQESCLHLENAVKYRFAIWEADRASLGILLNRKGIEQQLDTQFLELLRSLNRIVYRTAKHSVEDIHLDAHKFTPADALAVYLVCRWAGVKLLEPTGLFDYWKRLD